MNCAPVSRLSNEALLRELKASVAHDCTHTARQVELIAEVDKRRLYLPAGYDSMFTYCVGELVAERFPRPDVRAFVRAIPQPHPAPAQLVPVAAEPLPEGPEQPQSVAKSVSELAPAQVGGQVILGQLAAPFAPLPAEPRGRVTPQAPQRFAFQCTLGQEGRDLLRYAQEFMRHKRALATEARAAAFPRGETGGFYVSRAARRL